MSELGKLLTMFGVILTVLGLLLTFSDKLPFHPGRLPGDIYYKKENFSFYFPLTTSILLSIVLSLVLYLFGKFFK